MDDDDVIATLKARISELEKAALLSTRSQRLFLDPGEDERQEVMYDLTGRIIYAINDCVDDTVFFYCGPEMKGGGLLDYTDCGLYEQLEKLFASYKPEFDSVIGEAKNYHSVTFGKKSRTSVGEMKKRIADVLERAGAFKQHQTYI